jgi:hypothetical protein
MAANLAFSLRSVKSSVLEDGGRTVEVITLDIGLDFVVEEEEEEELLVVLLVEDPPSLCEVPVNKG